MGCAGCESGFVGGCLEVRSVGPSMTTGLSWELGIPVTYLEPGAMRAGQSWDGWESGFMRAHWGPGATGATWGYGRCPACSCSLSILY